MLHILLFSKNDSLSKKIIQKIDGDFYEQLRLFHATQNDQAINFLQNKKANIIFLDFELPENQNTKFYNQLCKEYSKIPVIALTNAYNETIDIDIFELGVQDHITSDEIEHIDFQRLISHACERHKLRHKLAEQNEQLKSAQVNMLQAEKLASLGQLSAGVAHEINNPLSFVISNVKTLEDYIKSLIQVNSESKKLINLYQKGQLQDLQAQIDIIESINKTKDMDYILNDIDQLMDETKDGLSRVKEIVIGLRSFARTNEDEFEIGDINDGIESTIRIVMHELKYRCQIEKCYGVLPKIKCKLGQLNQVFMNLLINAGQAIEEKGIVTIKTWTDEKNIYVSISDTGCGIKEENLKNLFDPFFTTKPIGKGTGLGLAVSYGIIVDHNGQINVDSTLGKGTTFTITLPIER